MQFVDLAKIHIAAGKGGNGVISFRREKYVPKGGPDGGNGGRGGSVIFMADPQLSTLLDFRYKNKYQAEDGKAGGTSNMTGRNGVDTIIKVPVGTIVKDAESGKILGDLTTAYEQFKIAKGGNGGLGNA
jgi:GTPase